MGLLRQYTHFLKFEEIREHLHYDADTGIFTWIRIGRGRPPVGSRAGQLTANGYRVIGFAGKLRSEGRLAWYFSYGSFPPKGMDIDHINRDPADNRLVNLRVATRSQNMANAKKRTRKGGPASQYKGVSWQGAWRAAYQKDGQLKFLGYFTNEIDAARAYDMAVIAAFGEYALPNFPRAACGAQKGRG